MGFSQIFEAFSEVLFKVTSPPHSSVTGGWHPFHLLMSLWRHMVCSVFFALQDRHFSLHFNVSRMLVRDTDDAKAFDTATIIKHSSFAS